MSEENQDGAKWKPGQTGNPNGRPKGKGKPISRLRSTLNKLKELEEDSIRNIGYAIRGVPESEHEEDQVRLDKVQVETSKWLITTLVAVTRAVVAEESSKSEAKSQDADADADKSEDNVVRFALHQNRAK